MLGRDFTAGDNKPGAEKVALLGYGIWQRDLGGSSDIVGKGMRINGKPATIVGVMPQRFAFRPTSSSGFRFIVNSRRFPARIHVRSIPR
jgi:hypothetical protein